MSLLKSIKAWFTAPTPQTTPLQPEPNAPETPQENEVAPEVAPSPPIPETEPEPTPEAPELPEPPELNKEINEITLRSETEFCGLMLEKAVLAHQTWVQNLESALRGQNPSIYKTKLASDDRLSELGMWLYKNESIFAPYSEYAILLEINKRFHECAGEVVEHHRQGHFADAILLLRRDLSLLSDEVQKSLVNLHKQVQEKGEKICE